MAERSTLNRRATSLPEVDKICVATKLIRGASTCDLNASSRPGQLLLFDARITLNIVCLLYSYALAGGFCHPNLAEFYSKIRVAIFVLFNYYYGMLIV